MLLSRIGVLASGGEAAGGFESIATVTGTGSSNTLTFSSIPTTYSSLQIRGIGFLTGATNDGAILRFNNVSFNSYAWHYIDGGGSTVSATGAPNMSSISFAGGGSFQTNSYPTVFIADIHDYSSTTRNKTVRIFAGNDRNGSGYLDLVSGFINNTNAVSSISFICNSGNWTTSTRFALYGIKGAA